METVGFWFFFLASVLGPCSSREVKVPAGPLFRVEGTSISIPCNVSRYEGPALQNFEWFMYRPDSPANSISIVSTKDPNFSYALFADRVKSGEIYIHRVSGDSVELRIKRLRQEDAGVFECYTPTTDANYYGSYSDKVNLQVIPDSLQVSAKSVHKGRLSAAPPLQLTLTEGRELHLSCSALSESLQHTHLSVSFGVTAPDAPVGRQTLQEIISVQRDFSVIPASTQVYSQRFQKGEVRVEKSDSSAYKMIIARALPQDAGTYHCTAAQWIQDPDGSWQKITEKRSVLAQVTVQTIESQLKVSSRPRELHVRSGETLEVFCNVSTVVPPPPDVLFSVDWLVISLQDSREQLVAAISTDGVVSLGENYAGADVGMRHISLEKLGPHPGSFRLRIHSAQPGDVGAYSCRVKAFVSYPGQELQVVASKISQPVTVTMLTQDVGLQVNMWLASPTLHSGDTALLLCNVSIDTTQSVHLEVNWWVELSEDEPEEKDGRLLVSVNREGVSELGIHVSDKELSVDKVEHQCYRLRKFNIQAADEGNYHCSVTAWIQYPDRSWYKATSAISNSIIVYPYAHAKDLLLIPLVGGVASALFVGITILSTVTCCYMRRLRSRKR
ncbi:immunoglobulin superfamily member 8 [Bombina bombina]|uniref:immunoglobulin superfamily member 8 n=1 Tax=Bombina bombina TaxID=8345 RepID=UPI00235B2FF1|nr:immunoglobulin superfamily member 8 [Bombina bombina]